MVDYFEAFGLVRKLICFQIILIQSRVHGPGCKELWVGPCEPEEAAV